MINIIGFIVWSVVFTIFDVIGWGKAIHNYGRDTSQNKEKEKTNIFCYRIMQLSFQASLTINIFFFFGWQSALAGLVGWQFGVCDYLYYVFGRYKLDDPLWWMCNWSIPHIIIKQFNKALGVDYTCPKNIFLIVIGLGTILALGVCLVKI